jgi:predicted ester cyclase
MKTRTRLTSTLVGMFTIALSMTAIAASAGSQADVIKRMHRFDQLDFDAFSKQNWKLFEEIHCSDVVVKFPDGHETHGIKQHVEDMIAMFRPMPDLRITAHPVSFGADDWSASTPDKRTSAKTLVPGEWTSTIGIMEGTFTQPLKMGDKTIQPTGKKLKIPMSTVAHWKNGCIAEEMLFWDNAAYLQQLGIVP